MSESSLLKINTKDGHSMSAYLAQTKNPEIGGIILLHEIFGLTTQMQRLADDFANAGYITLVPSLFDRIEPGACLDYSETERGKLLASACKQELLLLDLKAAIEVLDTPNISMIGYCWGGGLAYFAACNLPITRAAAFYGTRLPNYLHQQLLCPFQFHFGGQDSAIGPEIVEQVRTRNPTSEIHIYPSAGHAFANRARPNYHAASTALAQRRLLAFLNPNIS